MSLFCALVDAIWGLHKGSCDQTNSVTPQRTRNDRIAVFSHGKQSVNDARSRQMTNLVIEMGADVCRLGPMASFLDGSAHFYAGTSRPRRLGQSIRSGNYLQPGQKKKLVAW